MRHNDDSLPRTHRRLLDVQEVKLAANAVSDKEGIAVHRSTDVLSSLSANWPLSYDERVETNSPRKRGADMIRPEILNQKVEESGDAVLIDAIRKKLQEIQNLPAKLGHAETSDLTQITTRLLDLLCKAIEDPAKRDVMEQSMSTTFRTILLAIQSGLGNVLFEYSLPPRSPVRRLRKTRFEGEGWDDADDHFLTTDPWDGCQDIATEDFFDWCEFCLERLLDPILTRSRALVAASSSDCYGQDAHVSPSKTRHYVKRCFTPAETDTIDAHLSKLIHVMDVDCEGTPNQGRWSSETASTISGGSCPSRASAWTASTTNSVAPNRSFFQTQDCDSIDSVHSPIAIRSKSVGLETQENSSPKLAWRFRRNKTLPT